MRFAKLMYCDLYYGRYDFEIPSVIIDETHIQNRFIDKAHLDTFNFETIFGRVILVTSHYSSASPHHAPHLLICFLTVFT